MTRTIEVHIGETLDDVGRRFVDAWKRGEAGDEVAEDHLSFENQAALARHVSTHDIGLLRAIARHPADDVQGLAGRLGRDPMDVAAAIEALFAAGLVDRDFRAVHAVRPAMPKSA